MVDMNELDEACGCIAYWHETLTWWLGRGRGAYDPNVRNAVEMIEYSRNAVIDIVTSGGN